MKPRQSSERIREAIEEAEEVFYQTRAAIAATGHPHPELCSEPRDAWRAALPLLTDRASIQTYIACVAVGLGKGYVTADTAKVMLYTAQLALAAHGGNHASN